MPAAGCLARSLSRRSTHPMGPPGAARRLGRAQAHAPIGPARGSRRGAAAGHGSKDGRILGPTALGASALARQICRIVQRRGGASSERRAKAASALHVSDPPARRRCAWTPRPATWWATADRCAQISPAPSADDPPQAGTRRQRQPRRSDRDRRQPLGRRSAISSPSTPDRNPPSPPLLGGRPRRPARHATQITQIVCTLHECGVIDDVFSLTELLARAAGGPHRTAWPGHDGSWGPGTRVALGLSWRKPNAAVHGASVHGVRGRRRPWPSSCSWRMGLASGAS